LPWLGFRFCCFPLAFRLLDFPLCLSALGSCLLPFGFWLKRLPDCLLTRCFCRSLYPCRLKLRFHFPVFELFYTLFGSFPNSIGSVVNDQTRILLFIRLWNTYLTRFRIDSFFKPGFDPSFAPGSYPCFRFGFNPSTRLGFSPRQTWIKLFFSGKRPVLGLDFSRKASFV